MTDFKCEASAKQVMRRRLYQKWWWIKTNYPCTPSFLDFKKFYAWAMKTEWDGQANLKRFDECAPFDEGNCYWDSQAEEYAKAIQKSIEAYNKTVNRIRKHYGMPPVETLTQEDTEECKAENPD